MRAKPEPERRRFVAGVSLATTLILFIIWLSVVLPDFTGRREESQIAAPEPKMESPTANLGSGFSKALESVWSGLAGAGEGIGSIFEGIGTVHYDAPN